MPWKPAKPCIAQGCPNLVNGTAYCPAHRSLSSAARYDRERRPTVAALAVAARIRSGRQWQKVRALHRAMEPLCSDPFGDHAKAGRVALNEQSHHVLPLATHPHLAYDLGNLAPLCAACHGKVERLERAGRVTAGLFVKNGENSPTGPGGPQNLPSQAENTDAAPSRKTRGVFAGGVSPWPAGPTPAAPEFHPQ